MTSAVHLVFNMVGEVCRVMEKDSERHDKIYAGLQFIKREMEMVNALVKEKEYRGVMEELRIQQLQEFAYGVEDFLEGLWEPGSYGKVLVAIGMDPRPRQLRRIDDFKEAISSLKQEWWKLHSAESSRLASGSEDKTDLHDAAWSLPSPSAAPPLGHPPAAVEELEAIDGHKKKILELLSPLPGEAEQLRVVSIVGCRGVGKTALARALYMDCSASHDAFDCVAWVTASRCNDKKSLVDTILQSVPAALLVASRPEPDTASVPPPMEAEAGASAINLLQDVLSAKRCLVFIDDVQKPHMWKDTVDACKRNGSRSRIIVTTSVRSVATACSAGSYVYSMECLSSDDSERLFWRKVFCDQREPSYALKTASKNIFTKCGGLPLALTSVAKYLNLKGNDLQSRHFEEVEQILDKYYRSGNNNEVSVFKKMRIALTQCYDNLPDYDHRFFLLYLSIFPRGHQIKSKSLVRRLIAEGLVVNEGCCKCFNQLIDRCIVKPVQISNNSIVVKSYQVHDVVLEYIIQKSLDKNLVTLIKGHEPPLIGSTGDCVRRLSIQSSSEQRFDELEDKSAALRSLTMFKSEPFDLKSCKMLRLLDLEGCTGLDKRFLDGLCELLLLRYLSLRKTGINELPAQMEKLQRLEMLDIRETKVENLPIKVIMLPKIAYLFGKFQLSDVSKVKETNKLSDFLKKKSVLHTVSGYVTNRRHGPEHVILLAKNLKKVKVWCNDTLGDTGRSFPHIGSGSRSSQKKGMWCGKTRDSTRCDNFDFISLLKMRFTSLQSVSIVSRGLCKDFIGSLGGPCTIGSIKLRGNLDCLPDPSKLSELGRIKKLQLFSTGLTIKDLSALKYLRGLEYLKLVEYSDRFYNDIFIVERNGFESLKSLYIEAINVPRMQFNKGALENLTSLQLLCPNISPKQLPTETIEGILYLTNLSEVILHSSMQEAWETVADGHPNRPCVKRQQESSANREA